MTAENSDRNNGRFASGNSMAFKPGKSGNPGGRPAVPAEVLDACRALSLEAVEILRNWMHQSDDPAASVRACNSILDRAWGKPE